MSRKLHPLPNYQSTLEKLIQEWTALSQEARARGNQAWPQDLHPDYWAGVQFGLENAIEDLQRLLDEETMTPPEVMWRN